jgi:hypothetical protein
MLAGIGNCERWFEVPMLVGYVPVIKVKRETAQTGAAAKQFR